MKKLILLLVAYAIVATSNAQTINDALRYSIFDVAGTARTVGAGGGLGALGADFSVLSTNPAGLAAFRKSEFTFTPTLVFSNSDALLVGNSNNSQSDNKTNFNINNAGLVIARTKGGKVKTSNFGIGINRLANFHQQITYSGATVGSITDRWIELAFDPSTGGPTLAPDDLEPFEAGLAFEAGALFDITADGDDDYFYSTDFIEQNVPLDALIQKSQTINRKGGITELAISYALNVNNRFMFGATVGLPIVTFEELKTYRESDDANEIGFFNGLRFTERLETTGIGINLKLGMIYRASQTLRFGFAVHTPTAYDFSDTFSTEVAYDLDPDSGISSLPPSASDPGDFEYKLSTPWRFIGSAGLIIGRSGFISADIEYVNYSATNFDFNEGASAADIQLQNQLNDRIENEFSDAINIRIGGEYAYNIMRFRGGVSFRGTPLEANDDIDTFLSFGYGLRWERVFLDWAVRRIMNNETFNPYLSNGIDSPVVEVEDNRTQILMTVGVKF